MEYPESLLELSDSLQFLWNGHPGTVNTVTHRIELTSPYIRPTHANPYHAGLKERESEKEEIVQMPYETVTEAIQTEQASPVFFVPETGATLRFCVHY